MKTGRVLWCALLLLGAAPTRGAEESKAKPVPAMPADVTLTSGRVLRNVSVVRWEKERVVLRHAGGADPVAFSLIKSVSRADLELLREAGLAEKAKADQVRGEIKRLEVKIAQTEQQIAEQRQRNEEASAARCEEASRQGVLMAGQTYDQVRRVLGDSHRRNEYASGRETQEIYELDRGETWYVYYTGGRVTSWQRFSRRR